MSACAKGTGDDYGAFGATIGAAGDEGDDPDDGGDDKDEAGDAPMTGPVDADDGDDADAGEPPPSSDGDCCSGHTTPGCDDAAIAGCVCAQDSFCCDETWDDVCAMMVEQLGCGACGGDPGGGDPGDGGDPTGGGDPGDGGGDGGGGGGGGVGDCCAANNSPGCADGSIQTCVCNVDAYCCDTDWDSICVGLVDDEGCGSCGGGGGGGDGGGGGGGDDGGTDPGPTPMSDCCVAHQTAGCTDPAIQACVCAVDGFCCSTQWDAICVGVVSSSSCGDCSDGGGGDPPPMPGACCMPTNTPGCPAAAAVEMCVCAIDAFCCATQWDSICVDQVTTESCGTC